ncbi:MAG TPA: hypothetical protein VFP84_05340, partial [Kofleriaceae bacterium]|nr:hypothetical protein [Kofleriaceae bacterium]
GEEGGGLLCHRPLHPERGAGRRAWQLAPDRPRRFDPRTLPRGLHQVVGHTGHAQCLRELAGWDTAAARAHGAGGIRTLRVADDGVTYDVGLAAPAAGVADLILIDGGLWRAPVADVALLPLAAVA